MCERFRVPCVLTNGKLLPHDHEFVTNIGLSRGVIGRAASEFVKRLRWNTFLLIYQFPEDLDDIADLLSVWHDEQGRSVVLKVLQLPADSSLYDAFLKYVREKLKQTNIVVHTRDFGIIHTLLAHATLLNMTESRYSYFFTNPDLALLEDFFQDLNRIYRCNITGIQLVQHDPLMKTDLALTIDTVNILGEALRIQNERGKIPEANGLLCDANDVWRDGEMFSKKIREVELADAMTGEVVFSPNGQRTNTTLLAITRTNGKFSKVGH
uniref:Receptor ligand binding region domain-containing protein n=1 Tax=Acrobeloides nanus TaxID=290746 RepID=A0A914D1B9_9BILA